MLDGITEGFRITDKGSKFARAEMDNYKSISTRENRDLVEKQVREEIINGRYIVTKKKAKIISALGAIPKPNGKIRLIHDCSIPLNLGLNDYASIDKVRFQTVNEAPGSFHRITQTMRRMMVRRSFELTVVYLDDWLIMATTYEECYRGLTVLLEFLRELGFAISYSKVETPATSMVFLGINIDSQSMSISLQWQSCESY